MVIESRGIIVDIQNVFIIIGRKWNKDKIVKELKDEGYKHNFFFGQGQEFGILEKNILLCDEVWCFGDAEQYEMYEYAKKIAKDIWQMG